MIGGSVGTQGRKVGRVIDRGFEFIIAPSRYIYSSLAPTNGLVLWEVRIRTRSPQIRLGVRYAGDFPPVTLRGGSLSKCGWYFVKVPIVRDTTS